MSRATELSAESHCPNCNTEIESSFGPKTCPKCGTLVFVSFDGSVELPADATANETAPSKVDANESLPLENADEFSFDVEEPPVSSTAHSDAELSSIQAFANSEISDGHEGDLIFELKIEGLDTETVRRDLRDTLLDKRFKLDVDATMRNIRQGSLRIPDLSAVKASVFIHRLKELPLEVTWELRRLIDSVPSTPDGSTGGGTSS